MEIKLELLQAPQPKTRAYKDSREIFEDFKGYGKADREMMIALFLTVKNAVIDFGIITIGSLDNAIIHPREVFKSACLRSASSIILLHNHPSGDPAPSECDRAITRQLIAAGRILGIKVLDHIIIGRDSYYSMSDTAEMELYTQQVTSQLTIGGVI